MLLAIDIGNTNIVLSVFEHNTMRQIFRIETDTQRTEDEYASIIISLLTNLNLTPNMIDDVIISSVVPSLNQTMIRLFEKYFNNKPLFVGPGVKTGVSIKTENPKQLGADLIVGAVATKHKYKTPAIIIDFGTATTMGLLNENSEYLGTIIIPGVNTSISALASKAAKLPAINLEAPKSIVGKETIAAMQSGIVYGTAAMIDGMIDRINDEYGKELNVIATGGLSKAIYKECKHKIILDENLLLDGLKIIYDLNK